MEWHLMLLLIFGGFVLLLASGLPVAFAFLLFNLIGAFLLWGGQGGLQQLTLSITSSVAVFTLLPVPLFMLMGEVMYHSGIAPLMIDALDKWMGRLPGRLSLQAVAAGVVLSTLTGTTMASTAILGSVLVPEMEKRGYRKEMSLGPIMGSGGLAIMIPPSTVAVILGALSGISIGGILVGIIIPGLVMAAIFTIYILTRCWLQPSLAPPYDVAPAPLRERLAGIVRYVLPLGFVVFLVTGVIIVGIATPSEAAATGALGTFLLAALYKRLNWAMVKKAMTGTIALSIMILMLITGAKAFSQILAYTGATRGLIALSTGAPLAPIFILFGMIIVVLFLGCFVDLTAIMLITLPFFMPIVRALHFDLVWFAVVMMLCFEMSTITPPFGMVLFTMKGVAPAGTTMEDVYKAAFPFVVCDLLALALLISFPALALWLPNLMVAK